MLVASACAVGPDYVRPESPPVDHYAADTDPESTAAADGQVQRFEPGATVVGDWWTLFACPALDAAMKEAVPGNETLKAAEARLRESQDILRAGYGIFFPQIEASGAFARQKFTPASYGLGGPSSIFNLFTSSATISYALDVFGGQRRTVEGLGAQVDLQRYSVAATYLTLTANVANTMIAQAAYRDQIAATEEIIRVQRDEVSIAEAQAESGTAPYLNVLSLRAQLASFEATLPPLRQRLSQTGHLLATLAGRLPAEWRAPPVALADLKLPGNLPVTLPSMLVRQRPDVLVAEAQLHGASAAIGVATAAMFPSFTLKAGAGANSTAAGDLFAGSNTFWSLGAGVTAPIFQGGTLRYRREAAIDEYEATLASYRQTVLNAFAQVADTLRALEHDAEALEAQSRALASADEALRLVQANYQTGLASYLQVLTAFSQYYQAKVGYLQAVAQRLQDSVALFAALGGGWWDADKSLLDASQPVDGARGSQHVD